jgi:hypothetical protein
MKVKLFAIADLRFAILLAGCGSPVANLESQIANRKLQIGILIRRF